MHRLSYDQLGPQGTAQSLWILPPFHDSGCQDCTLNANKCGSNFCQKRRFTCRVDPTRKTVQWRRQTTEWTILHAVFQTGPQPYQTALFYTKLKYIALRCAIVYCTVLYCTLQYFPVLYCIILYCTVLYWSAPDCTLKSSLKQVAWLRLNSIEYSRFQCPLKYILIVSYYTPLYCILD